MNEISENSIVNAIQNEYNKIDNKWLKLHYYTFIGLVIFGFVAECFIGLAWFQTGEVDISPMKYIVKYILAPLLFNTVLILIGIWAMRASGLQQTKKMYVISLLFVGSCFVFYMVHSIFLSLFLIFTAPILLTVVYSDYKLTTITASVSIALKTIADLFVVWDPDKINLFEVDVGIADFVVSIFLLFMFFVVCLIVIRFEKEKNAASIQKEIEHYQTQQRLNIDDLTEIYNRTALRKAFQNVEKDSSENTYIFVMIDIDNFKALNDTYGHGKGDGCLMEFAGILKENCKSDSMPFRFGGDEFCILFKNESLENVVAICKNIQRDFRNSKISTSDMQMTASFGIAAYKKQMTVNQFIKNTDSALYRAKEAKDFIYIYYESDFN